MDVLSISVVVPSRNRPQLVKRAVKSALAQAPQVLEVIVVLDGPDAASVESLSSIEDGRLIVVERDVPHGTSAARNCGIARATGRWIALLDDDDEWLPEKIQYQWQELVRLGADANVVVASGFVACLDHGDVIWPKRPIAQGETVGHYLFVRRLPGEGMLCTPTLLVSRKLALTTPFPEHLRVHEDWDWLLQLESQGATFSVVLRPLAIVQFTSRPDSGSGAASWQGSLAWALTRNQELGPEAFAGFLTSEVARKLPRGRSPLSWLAVALLAATGQLRPRDWGRMLAVGLLSKQRRQRLVALRAKDSSGPTRNEDSRG